MHRLLIVILAMWTSIASADVPSLAPFKGWPIERVIIRGVPGALASELSAGLASSGKSGILKGERAVLFREIVDSDIERIRLHLARSGHPYATITAGYEGHGNRRRVSVIFDVELSTPVVVDSVSVVGLPESLSEVDGRWRRIETGQVFRDSDLDASVAALRRLLGASGYARAEVSSEVTVLDRDRVDVNVRVKAGSAYRFDGVRVEGAREDLVALVTMVTDVEAGDPYSTEALKRARYQLQLLGLFSRIQLSIVDTAPGRLDLVVDVTESPFRTTELGVGYWTDDLFRVRARWQHRNLFGRGRAFRLNGFASGRRRQAGAAAWWPGIMGARILGRVRGSVEQEIEETYELADIGAEASLTYRHSLFSTLGVGVELSWIDVDEKTDDAVYEEEGGRVLTGYVTWNRRATDDAVDPTTGTDVGWHAESTIPGRFSESHHVRLDGTAKAYASPMEGVVIATRLGGGVAWPTESSADLLPNVRFFAGGGRSMRGFERRRLGPVDSDGEPVGGEALVEASAEVRFPVWWKIRAAAFVDGGNVWANRHDASVGELEYAAGPAVMVTTPVGPIRADLGFRLGTISDGEPRTAFHLSIGHPF